MNSKILAAFMALTMVVAAVAVSVPATAGAPQGTEGNPYYLVGSDDVPAVLHKGKTFTSKIDFNEAAYDLQGAVAFEVKFDDGAYKSAELGTAVKGTYYSVTIDSSGTTSSDKGIYKVEYKYIAPSNNPVKCTIKIDLTTEFKGETLILNYYYAANITSSSSDSSSGEIKLTAGENATDVKKDGSQFKIYKGSIPVIDVKLLYDKKEVDKSMYSVYASGLPAGLSVKVNTTDGKADWIITGKADSSIAIDEKKGYNEYDVVVNTVDSAGNITTKNVKVDLYPSDVEFSYQVIDEDGTVTSSDKDMTKVIKAGDSIDIRTLDPSGTTPVNIDKVYYSANGEMKEIPVVDGKYTYTSGDTDSGVIEIVMQNSDGPYTVQHKVTVLVVGEIVHSGLNPVVSSM